MADRDVSHAVWRKSSRSGSSGGDCVEIAVLGARQAVRDSKDPAGGFLSFGRDEWAALVAEIKQGRYDVDEAF
ncbi:DUF397 domain-containing protein [Actinomadura nitritigenes]|uniref:DUF397 domain-containing protein n=1 Tax=Actinomadura nitritigenes TaxID=134602 RepID=UPI003D9412DE